MGVLSTTLYLTLNPIEPIELLNSVVYCFNRSSYMFQKISILCSAIILRVMVMKTVLTVKKIEVHLLPMLINNYCNTLSFENNQVQCRNSILGERLGGIWQESSECKEQKENTRNLSA